MHTHDICAYTAGQLKVDEVNVVPAGKIFLCVVLCGICTCYVVVYTCECLYVHMCVHVCMHTHGCRSQRLTCGVFPQLFFPLFETRSITKPESMQLCQWPQNIMDSPDFFSPLLGYRLLCSAR